MAAVTGLPTDVVSAFLDCSRVENSTAQTASSSGSNEHAVVVTPFNDFVGDDVPSVFRTKEQSSESDPEKKTLLFELINPDDVTLCIDEPRANWFPQNKGCMFKFEDDLQLSTITNTLLSRPILMNARIRFETIEKSNRDFLLLINTKHPDIREPMQRALDNVMERARKGNSLAIEFDFSNVIVQWIRKLLHQWDPSSPSSLSASTPLTLEAKLSEFSCAGAQLVVTNTTAIETMYVCRDLNSVKVFICCLPCCLLTCPCYRIHRYLTVHDKRVVFSADVTFLPLARKYATERHSLEFLKNSLFLTFFDDAETIAHFKMTRDPEALAEYLQMNELMMIPPKDSEEPFSSKQPKGGL